VTASTHQPPYHAYATIVGTFVGGLAAAATLARLLGRDPRENTALDLVAEERDAGRGLGVRGLDLVHVALVTEAAAP
jgi:hypothetical protein